MALAYFDSSALVKLVVEEASSDLAAELWDGCDAALSSRLAYPEVRSALAATVATGTSTSISSHRRSAFGRTSGLRHAPWRSPPKSSTAPASSSDGTHSVALTLFTWRAPWPLRTTTSLSRCGIDDFMRAWSQSASPSRQHDSNARASHDPVVRSASDGLWRRSSGVWALAGGSAPWPRGSAGQDGALPFRPASVASLPAGTGCLAVREDLSQRDDLRTPRPRGAPRSAAGAMSR